MISLPLSSEAEQLIENLSEAEKKTLALMISAFVTRPKRSMKQVMDDMADFANKQGMDEEGIGKLLEE